jgi:hypothetical protein
VYVGGLFSNVAAFGSWQLRTPNKFGDGYVMKLDGAGVIVWARPTGFSGSGLVDGVVVAANGSVFATGIFSGALVLDDGQTISGAGQRDAFLLELKQQSITGRVHKEGSGVAGVVVELFDADEVSLGTRLTDERGAYRFSGPRSSTSYSLRFRLPPGFTFPKPPGGDAAENRSEFNLPADGKDHRHDVALAGQAEAFKDPVGAPKRLPDADGGFCLAGLFSGTVDFDTGPGVCNLTSNRSRDVFVAKYAASGALLWAGSCGGTADEDLTEWKILPGGNIVLLGEFTGNVDFDPGPERYLLLGHGGRHRFEATLDSAGKFVSARRLPAPSEVHQRQGER